MPPAVKTISVTALSLALITVAAVIMLQGRGRAELSAVDRANDMNLQQISLAGSEPAFRPPIDLEVPAQLETATFALG